MPDFSPVDSFHGFMLIYHFYFLFFVILVFNGQFDVQAWIKLPTKTPCYSKSEKLRTSVATEQKQIIG